MEPTEAQIAKAPAQRIDWRTGKPMPQRDDAFWQDHDSRRREAGLSVPQYCAEHGLALSTYRTGSTVGNARQPIRRRLLTRRRPHRSWN